MYGLAPVHLLVAGVGGVTRVTRPSETRAGEWRRVAPARVTCHVSRVTSAVHGEPQPVLLGLEQLPVDGDLHVEGDLGVHQALVLLLVPAQLLQQLLYLTLLRSNLKINISHLSLALGVQTCKQQ